MANTYQRMYLQIVFAVKNRQALLKKEWREELFKYIAGTIKNRNHYSFAVNGVQDHIHIFFDYKGHELISDFVREIKKSSNKFINENYRSPEIFEWQSGYGVFSHGYREKDIIINYVKNQQEHHVKKSFRQEYLQLLKAFEVEYKDEYIFEFFE